MGAIFLGISLLGDCDRDVTVVIMLSSRPANLPLIQQRSGITHEESRIGIVLAVGMLLAFAAPSSATWRNSGFYDNQIIE